MGLIMENSFDFIAIPKGQLPGGPVQASDGTWYLVLPAMLDLAGSVRLIEQMRAGRPVTDKERHALAAESGQEVAQQR